MFNLDADGLRILVDRFWPKGIAPSNELRKWYGHNPEKWTEFKNRYFAELDDQPEQVGKHLGYLRKGNATFVYSSTGQRFNHAVALKEYIEPRI